MPVGIHLNLEVPIWISMAHKFCRGRTGMASFIWCSRKLLRLVLSLGVATVHWRRGGYHLDTIREGKPLANIIEVRLFVRVGEPLAGGRHSSNKLSNIRQATQEALVVVRSPVGAWTHHPLMMKRV
jgi:hypothetical protein